MTTTEQQIAAFTQQAGLLLDLPQQIANTATAQINAVGNAYQTRLNTSVGTFWIDQVNGLDTNPGTQASPLKTITKALTLVPMGGRCECRLLTGYTIDTTIVVDNRQLILTSFNTVRHPIQFTRKLNQNVVPNQRDIAGIRLIGQASLAIHLLGIVIPPLDGQWGTYNSGSSELFGSYGSNMTGAQSVAITSCDITIPETPYSAFVSPFYPITLLVSGVTLLDQPLNGKVVRSITATAGTATSTLPYLNTNLLTV